VAEASHAVFLSYASQDAKAAREIAEALRLQISMDRRSKFLETLSNILKKIDQVAAAITTNIK
jgi:Asp-tRNA(Asn)/Glu-tRNA(Gln) amidotransferase C subunit